MRSTKVIVVVIFISLVAAFFIFGLNDFFNLTYLKGQHDTLRSYCQENLFTCISIYFGIYLAITSLSLPGAGLLTVLGGAMFGLLYGVIVVSFASSIGALISFLVARYLLRDYMQARFKDRLNAINAGIERDGAFYLFGLRLVFIIPYFMVNVLMALTPIKAFTFFWVSQVGMLAGTFVYVNAGTQLAKINSLKDILSLELALAFILLGLLPLIAKKTLDYLNQKRHAQA